jgi:hypothetical protein
MILKSYFSAVAEIEEPTADFRIRPETDLVASAQCPLQADGDPSDVFILIPVLS